MRTLLIVSMLDYGYFANSRVHHLVEQFKNRFERVMIIYKKVHIPGTLSFAEQVRAFVSYTATSVRQGNTTIVEMDPICNHIDGFGLNMLGITNPYSSVSSRGVSLLKKLLSNMGLISDLFLPLSFLLAYILRVRSKIDIYIGQGPWEAAAGYVLKRLGMVKVLVYDDIDYAPGYHHARFRKGIVMCLERFLMRRSDVVTSVGDLLRQLREQETGRRVEVIPNGVDYALFSQAQDKVPHPPTLIYMGYVWDWAGVDVVVKALPAIKARVPEIRFLVVGHSTPAYVKYLENVVAEVKVAESFEYVGSKRYPELVDYLKRADIGMALFRSIELRKYAFPLKVIEYMAAGLPVITTRGTQAEIILKKHRCGDATEVLPDELSECVCALLTDQERYRRYSQNAITDSLRYDWQALMGENYELMKHCYERKGHTPKYA